MDFLKPGIALDAHMFEIDKEKLKNVYNFPTKKRVEYEIIEKKIIYAKDDKKTNLSKEDYEKKYYNEFKFFREYLTTGFESDEIKHEISEMKTLVEHSKNLRENLMNHFGIQNNDFENKDLRDSISGISNRSLSLNSVFQKGKIFSNLIKMCKLLTKKTEEVKKENNPVFQLYSELDNPSDIYSFSINENFLANRLLEYKKKLTKSYYQEEFFSNFAKNYHTHSSNNNIPLATNESVSQISPEIKLKFPVDYIDSIFRPRESECFYQIDSFMSLYGVTQKANLNEKDLYENIYGILSKCNYANFLSFLYSKNNLFKYIYDEFASKKGNLSESLENVNLSRIDSVETETDKFFRGNELLISPKDRDRAAMNNNNLKRPTTTRSLHKENVNNLDEFMSNYFFDKISFFNEKIEEKIAEVLLKENSSSILNQGNKNIQGQFIKGSILNLFKNMLNKDFSHALLINKNERFRIFNYSNNSVTEESHNNSGEIDEDARKIQLYKIDKKFILDRFSSLSESLAKDPIFKDIFNNVTCYFIVEIRKYFNNNSSKKSSEMPILNSKFSLSALSVPNFTSNFYLFRTANENSDRFEFTCKYLRLFDKPEERAFSSESMQPNNNHNFDPANHNNSNFNTVNTLNPSNNDYFTSLHNSNLGSKDYESSKKDLNSNKDNNEENINNSNYIRKASTIQSIYTPTKNEEKQKGNPTTKRVSQYDEDYLGISNDDILKEVLYSKFPKNNSNNKEKEKDNLLRNFSGQKSGGRFEEEDDDFDFKNLINKEHKKNKKDSNQNLANIKEDLNPNNVGHPDISFKENYMFRINNNDYKVSFSERNNQMVLTYYKYSSNDEENSSNPRTVINLSAFKDYSVTTIEEGKNYHSANIQLRYNDSSKSPLEIVSLNKDDFVKFIGKIDTFVKKL